MVSIIMPCYNSEKYISLSIESVLAQSMTEWELLLINDASTDNTKEVIDLFSQTDSRIRTFHLEKNSSASVARNLGIANAKYNFIAFLDSDDLWLEDKLSRQISWMEKNDIPFCYSSYYLIDCKGSVLGIKKAPASLTYNKLLNYGNNIGCLTVIYNRVRFLNIRFNEEIPIHEDYKMWLDIFQNFDYALAIQEPLAFYRIHPGSKNFNKIRSLKWNWVLWRNYEKQNLLKTSIISIRWIFNKIVEKVLI